MKSATLPSFWTAYARLDENAKSSSPKAFHLWQQNPFHPSLRFKCIHRDEGIWSARISRGLRAVGVLQGDTVTWFWVGTHDDYDRLFG